MKPNYHHWDKWECYKAGFYNLKAPSGLTKDECQEFYQDFLSDLSLFEAGMKRVLKNWPNSCEQFLSRKGGNKIAWMGQAACCIELGIPAMFRGGYRLLSVKQQKEADELAQKYINIWEEAYVKKKHRNLFKEMGS